MTLRTPWNQPDQLWRVLLSNHRGWQSTTDLVWMNIKIYMKCWSNAPPQFPWDDRPAVSVVKWKEGESGVLKCVLENKGSFKELQPSHGVMPTPTQLNHKEEWWNIDRHFSASRTSGNFKKMKAINDVSHVASQTSTEAKSQGSTRPPWDQAEGSGCGGRGCVPVTEASHSSSSWETCTPRCWKGGVRLTVELAEEERTLEGAGDDAHPVYMCFMDSEKAHDGAPRCLVGGAAEVTSRLVPSEVSLTDKLISLVFYGCLSLSSQTNLP